MILERIKFWFCKKNKKYGSPRIHKQLQQEGFQVGRNRIARLMRENGLVSTYKRPRRPRTTDSNHDKPVSPNLLNRNFHADAPNQKWVSDITYIDSQEGWLYLCIIKDLWNKEIVGWSVANHMRSSLVLSALNYAITRKNPQPGLIFHSDRGSQFASAEFRSELAKHGIIQSMSRKGNCYDNAPAESFFATLKCEKIYDITIEGLAHAEKILFEYIEIEYNRSRSHSAIGYISPAEYAAKRAA